jgi:hypothetical protein
MSVRIATLRACSLLLLLVVLSGCDEGSPTGPRTSAMLGTWEATQSVAVPECNFAFSQTLRVEIRRGEGSSEIFGHVAYPGLGSCALSGHTSGSAVRLESYRCFPFGYACDGQTAVCVGDRHLSLCPTATWNSLHVVFADDTGSGSVSASVAAFDPATGERVTTFQTEDAVTFRRSGN